MRPVDRKKLRGLLLFILLTGAFLLRVQQASRMIAADESWTVQLTLQLYRNPFPISWDAFPGYPPFFMYLNFLISLIFQKLLVFLGFLDFNSSFAQSGFGPSFILQTGRILSACWGTLLVYWVYRIGRDYYDGKTAFAAATLMAANPFMIQNSHIFKPDILLALLLLMMLHQTIRFVLSPRYSAIFISTFLLGLATATKYNGAVEVIFLAAAFAMTWKRVDPRTRVKMAFGGAACGIAGFAVGAPNWILHPFLSLHQAFDFTRYHYETARFFDQQAASYIHYAGDFIAGFGWLFFILLFLGIAVAVIKRDKPDTTIVLYIAIYFLLLGRSNFYSNRVSLPLFGAAAILITKTLFCDIPKKLERSPGWRRGFVNGSILAVLAFSSTLIVRDIKTFNLLSTASQWSRAENYRKGHIPDIFPVASESFTPHHSTDQGIWDLTRLPLGSFQGDRAVDFVVTGLLSDYILHRTHNRRVKTELHRRLSEYRPFYRASKTRFSPWDGDIIFWYRAPLEFREAPAPSPPLPLPRTFLLTKNAGTVFLPLQTYEKNPFFGKIENGLYCQTLYSTRRIEKIRFTFLFPEDPSGLVLTLNGKRQLMKKGKGGGIRLLEASGFEPLKLYFDFVYRIELIEAEKGTPCSFVFAPVYDSSSPPPPSRNSDFRWTASGKIPELFSRDPTPPWVAFVFRRTGINLSLLTFINRTEIVHNDDGATADSRTDWFPLENGRYTILLSLQPLVPEESVGDACRLKWESISTTGVKSEAASDLPPMGSANRLAIPMTVRDPLAFFRISIEHLRANNLLLRSMIIQPDYREWFRDKTGPVPPAGMK